jgi:hypothetical protein
MVPEVLEDILTSAQMAYRVYQLVVQDPPLAAAAAVAAK